MVDKTKNTGLQARTKYVSNPKHTFYNFGLNHSVLDSNIKFKNTFMASFVIDDQAISEISDAVFKKGFLEYSDDRYAEELAFAVKTIDKPKINVDLQTLNQYNKKRIVQQNLDYQAINVRLYDTGKGAAQKMIKQYFQFYFGDQRATDSTAWSDDILNDQLSTNNNFGWGFNPLSNNLFFFKEINVFQMHGQRKYDKFTYIHPKIQSVDMDMNDYSVSEGNEISITFLYESVLMDLDNDIANGGIYGNSFRLKDQSQVPTWESEKSSTINVGDAKIKNGKRPFEYMENRTADPVLFDIKGIQDKTIEEQSAIKKRLQAEGPSAVNSQRGDGAQKQTLDPPPNIGGSAIPRHQGGETGNTNQNTVDDYIRNAPNQEA